MIATNILQALVIQRPEDKIVKVFNNKFAIVKSAYTNGKFADESICFLNDNTVYFYPANIKGFNKWFKYMITERFVMDKKYIKTLTKAYQLINNL